MFPSTGPLLSGDLLAVTQPAIVTQPDALEGSPSGFSCPAVGFVPVSPRFSLAARANMQNVQQQLAYQYLPLGQRDIIQCLQWLDWQERIYANKAKLALDQLQICYGELEAIRMQRAQFQQQLTGLGPFNRDLHSRGSPAFFKAPFFGEESLSGEEEMLASSALAAEEPAPIVSAAKRPKIQGAAKDLSVLSEFFPAGTKVTYEKQERSIQGHAANGNFILAPIEGEEQPVEVPITKLTYWPQAGDICLIRETQKADSYQRYYKARILTVQPGKRSHFVKFKFVWIDYGQQDTRQCRGLGTVVPLSSEKDPLLGGLRQESVSNSILSKIGIGYYLQRKE